MGGRRGGEGGEVVVGGGGKGDMMGIGREGMKAEYQSVSHDIVHGSSQQCLYVLSMY